MEERPNPVKRNFSGKNAAAFRAGGSGKNGRAEVREAQCALEETRIRISMSPPL